ncbi:hypothetical protein LOD99_4247 [Oopsacas minuta]|uniref:Rab5-interacting protein n=1 Tax=Oopsacas minuta TaxID=111878 RepID=A0AAV7JW22_9METZ|nr:hypothetical protein LOD99_4247 [Oopsacas minuta]
MEESDAVFEKLYWIRQGVSLVLGVVWGAVPLTGIFAILGYLALISAVVYICSVKIENVDIEDMGGIQEVLKDGLMTGFGMFMITWIIMFTSLHS